MLSEAVVAKLVLILPPPAHPSISQSAPMLLAGKENMSVCQQTNGHSRQYNKMTSRGGFKYVV